MNSNTVRDPRRWWILVVLCLSLLVLMIDGTILNLAIPSLVTQLGATPADIQWILDSYVLVFAGLLLTAGSLSDRYGRRRILVIGLTFFGLASAAATVATEPWQLVAARAAMGVGGALVMPSTLSILMTTFDADERRTAMAAWSTVSIVGVVLGPTLGGFLLEHFWWGSVFLINVPVAALAVVAALVLMPESTGARRPLDPIGVVLSVLALGSVVFVIIERAWNPVALGAAAAAVVAFVVWEARAPHPVLPVGIFADRDFSGTAATLLLMVFGTGAVLLMLTQYLQFVLGYGPMRAGLALLPYAIAATLCNGLGAALGKRVENRTLIVSGLSVMGGAFAILAVGTGYTWVLASMLVMGAGAGLAGPAAYASIMNAIPLEHAGVGSAVNDTLQQVGLAVGIAVVGSVLAGVFTANMPADAPDAARESIGAAFELGFVDQAKDAFSAAMSTAAWIGAGCTVAAALLGAVLLRPRRDPEPAAESEVAVS